jgi:SynChlorMet cassette radical SAM/SPASM protein ScmE
VDVSVTGRCNAKCTYCFYADEMEQRPDLPTDAWLAFFDELGSLAVRSVCLSGGEVFTRPDLWTLIDRAIDNRMRYSLLSNGTLVDDAIVARLLERRTRLDSIQVSIDGSCAEIHDASRGRGSFEKALRGLRLLKQAGLPVTSRVTINRHNVGDLEGIAELLLNDVGLRGFSTNDAVEMGSCRHADSIRLPPELERAAMLTLARLDQRYPGRVTALAGPLVRWRMFHAMETARFAGGARTPLMGRLTACGCVFDKIAVNHDGTITPCNMLATMVMGRIGETPIRDIWRGHPHLRSLRERREIPMDDVAECKDCDWRPFCNGSCPAVPFAVTGSLRSPHLADCYRRFLAEGGHVPAL